MPLSDQQLQALETIEWLLDSSRRRSGRSMVIAVAAIRLACQRPGHTVIVHDHPHEGAARGRDNMNLIIRHLVRTDYMLEPRAQIQSTRGGVALRILLPRPIEDWFPNEVALDSLLAAERGHEAGLRVGATAAEIGTAVHQAIEEAFQGPTSLETARSDSSILRFASSLTSFAETFRVPDGTPTITIDSVRGVVEPEPEPKSRWEVLLEDD